jgi:C4-dicarboxylate-specific signal transduction histidine kinase
MREHEIAFIGRVTAGVTHEFLNVLATINEASGLLKDILDLNRSELSSWGEKAMEAVARIQMQVGRGTEYSERLNAFAHSLDDSSVSIDLNDTLDQIAFLMQHAARLKRVVLQTQHCESSPALASNPLHLQIALAVCIDHCLDFTDAGGLLLLTARDGDDAVTVRCEAAPSSAPVEEGLGVGPRFAALAELIDGLGLRVVRDDSRSSVGVELHVPHR